MESEPGREKPCTHAGAYKDHPDYKLCGFVDIEIEKARKLSEKFNVDYYNNKTSAALEKVTPDVGEGVFHGSYPSCFDALSYHKIGNGWCLFITYNPGRSNRPFSGIQEPHFSRADIVHRSRDDDLTVFFHDLEDRAQFSDILHGQAHIGLGNLIYETEVLGSPFGRVLWLLNRLDGRLNLA